jgi:UDP-N-acetylglucosamine--N-acetylmuramyl-(pentapeptide) pyrophosphoryl-undecaprenol N-acetylglucosamine transferase
LSRPGLNRTIMIMAGGTGGHVMPGLAVAAEMRDRSWQVVWLGNPAGMEASIVPRHGIALEAVRVGGVRGKGVLTKLLMPAILLRAFWQSLRALRRVRPAVVLGMGGYVAFPGAMMAVLIGRPLVVHEQNSVAGLTNRILARIADRVLQAFPGALEGARVCGNPVSARMAGLPEPASRYGAREGPLRILVVGGSLGAQALNQAVAPAIALLPAHDRPVVLHQCGRGRRNEVASACRAAGVEAAIVEFIDDMPAAYADADLLVCRAGAMTVSEIAAVGVASILVPFPHAVDDHQSANARQLSDAGAAILLPQKELSAERLASIIASLDRETCARMAGIARSLARTDSASIVADVCEEVAAR